MDHHFDELLKRLFLGTVEEFRELMKDLTEEQRAEYNQRLSPLLDSIAASYDAYQHYIHHEVRAWATQNVNTIDIDALYRKAVNGLPEKSDSGWFLDSMKSVPGASGVWDRLEGMLYENSLVVRFGIGDGKTLTKIVKKPSRYDERSFYRYPLPFVELLLDRPETWISDVALSYIVYLAKMQFPPAGLAMLVTDCFARFPEWREALRPYFGKIFLSENQHQGWRFESIDPDIMLTGFAEGISFLPRDEVIVTLANLGKLPKEPIRETIFSKLREPSKNHVIANWLKLYDALHLSPDEKSIHAEFFLDLLTAPTAGALKLGIAEVTALLNAGRISPDRIVPLVAPALRHESVGAAGDAFGLLKKCVERGFAPEAVVPDLLDALGSPHKKLRRDIVKWLKKHRFSLSSDDAANLAFVAENLPSDERADLAEVLPQVAPVVAQSPAPSDPRERITALLADVESASLHGPAANWHKYLKHFVATGETAQFPRSGPDFTYALEHTFEPFATPEDVANALLEAGNGESYLHFERCLDGIRRFPEFGRSDHVGTAFEALTERAKEQIDIPDGRKLFRFDPREILNFVLLGAWHKSGDVFFTSANESRSGIVCSHLPLIRRVQNLCDRLKSNHSAPFLATPTHAVGWIHPATFAERFLVVPRDLLEVEDLTAALYRLVPSPAERHRAWERIAPTLAFADDVVPRAVAVALAPDEIARASIQWFQGYFSGNPPTDPLFFPNRYHLVDDPGMYERFNAAHNLAFRLFCAAIRCRYGLDDAKEAFEEISTEHFEIVEEKTVSDREALARAIGNASNLEYLIDQALLRQAERTTKNNVIRRRVHGVFVKKLLFHPEKNGQERVRKVVDWETWCDYSFFPHLEIYSARDARLFFDVEPLVLRYRDWVVSRFPPIAQRLFEDGARNIGFFFERFTTSAAIGNRVVVGLGILGHVDALSDLAGMVAAIRFGDAAYRESVVDLVVAMVRDGRATPGDVADAFSNAFRETKEGLKRLDEALASLSVAFEAGRLMVLRVVETILARGAEALPARNLGTVLDRLQTLIEETGRGITSPDAIATLRTLAEAKKKSANGDRARHLVTLVAGRADLPLDVDIAASLLAER